MVDRVKAHVSWSIYLKTSNKRDVQEVHLPPITAALEGLEFDWSIFTEHYNPGLFRVVTYQNLTGRSVEDVVIPVLRRAYQLLAIEWTISGLDDLAAGVLDHVSGYCYIRPPPKKPPSIESVLFELEPVHIRRVPLDEAIATGWTCGAKWQLVEEPPRRRRRKRRGAGRWEASDEVRAFHFGKPDKPRSPDRPAPPDAHD